MDNASNLLLFILVCCVCDISVSICAQHAFFYRFSFLSVDIYLIKFVLENI